MAPASPHDPAHHDVTADIDRESRLIADAIAMVASGGSPRVTVGNLRFTEQLLPAARKMAAVKGVRLTALWTMDEAGADIVVEPAENPVR